MRQEKEKTTSNRKAGAPSDDDRELQVAAGGFPESEETKIVEEIRDFLRERGVNDKVGDIFTYTDPARIGVIEFKTLPGKVGFLRKFGPKGFKTKSGTKI